VRPWRGCGAAKTGSTSRRSHPATAVGAPAARSGWPWRQRWPADLGTAVEKAARIGGDSDSVACLTGALLGAALGTRAIPPNWLATLPQRDAIQGLADRLLGLSEASTSERVSRAPLVVIGDLHGHLDLFERLLARIDAEFPQARVVTLGDYVDNGPQIPALLDRLIDLKAQRPTRFFPILGNHDLALLRALGWPGTDPDPEWFERWRCRYWNPGLGTPQAYGANDLKGFERAFPLAHYRFLAALPWYHDDGEYLCVHAGLHAGPIGPQRARLAARELPAEKLRLPDALREKQLAGVHDPVWDRTVVSGHTYLPGQRVHLAPRRICLSATSDHEGSLLGLTLPGRHGWKAMPGEVCAWRTE
jgi:hypothetical protein